MSKRNVHRSDHAQKAVIEALRRCGVHVEVMGRPVDLLCSHRGLWAVLEIKSDVGKLTQDQEEFMNKAQAPVHVVRSPEEAIRAVLGDEVLR